MLREYGNELEADIPRFYPGHRLRDLATGEVTYREMMNWIRHLPRESAYVRAVHGEIADWTTDTAFLARLVNLLIVANAQRAGKDPGSNEFIQPPPSKLKNKTDQPVLASNSSSNGDRKLSREEFDALFN